MFCEGAMALGRTMGSAEAPVSFGMAGVVGGVVVSDGRGGGVSGACWESGERWGTAGRGRCAEMGGGRVNLGGGAVVGAERCEPRDRWEDSGVCSWGRLFSPGMWGELWVWEGGLVAGKDGSTGAGMTTRLPLRGGGAGMGRGVV